MPCAIFATHFVEQISTFAQHYKAVREAHRHVKLVVVVVRKFYRNVFSVGRRTLANIHSDIQNSALNHRDEFRLRLGKFLVMQSAQDVLARARVIVLNKHINNAARHKLTVFVVFLKKAARVTAYLWLHEDDFGDSLRFKGEGHEKRGKRKEERDKLLTHYSLLIAPFRFNLSSCQRDTSKEISSGKGTLAVVLLLRCTSLLRRLAKS
jgi:hypothetical protein